MKALTFKRYGKSPEIGFSDVPRPTLKANELLVQVHAASVNPIDNMIPTGMFKPLLKFPFPATLGSDLAGVVQAVGSRVTRFKPGDAIFASRGNLYTVAQKRLGEIRKALVSAAGDQYFTNPAYAYRATLPLMSKQCWKKDQLTDSCQNAWEKFVVERSR